MERCYLPAGAVPIDLLTFACFRTARLAEAGAVPIDLLTFACFRTARLAGAGANSGRSFHFRDLNLAPFGPQVQQLSASTHCATRGPMSFYKALYSPSLFNLYAENVMQCAGLDESKAGVKIDGRNINNLRYADDTTLMAESKEELRSLITKVREKSAKSGLQLNIKKTKIIATRPIDDWQKEGKDMETVTDFVFLGTKILAARKSVDVYFLGEEQWPTSTK
uniref:Reverse transcriptase domain-containing protein n=1 Tax=Anolis carolinensis TaxID=28377 RepID=A0A803SMZ1_ANOCA